LPGAAVSVEMTEYTTAESAYSAERYWGIGLSEYQVMVITESGCQGQETEYRGQDTAVLRHSSILRCPWFPAARRHLE